MLGYFQVKCSSCLAEIRVAFCLFIDCFIFKGGKVVGINPKINNMVQGYDVAKNELILISDAGLKSKYSI